MQPDGIVTETGGAGAAHVALSRSRMYDMVL